MITSSDINSNEYKFIVFTKVPKLLSDELGDELKYFKKYFKYLSDIWVREDNDKYIEFNLDPVHKPKIVSIINKWYNIIRKIDKMGDEYGVDGFIVKSKMSIFSIDPLIRLNSIVSYETFKSMGVYRLDAIIEDYGESGGYINTTIQADVSNRINYVENSKPIDDVIASNDFFDLYIKNNNIYTSNNNTHAIDYAYFNKTTI